MNNTQPMQSEPLDVHSLPLTGVRLIEASAGTGKTYTITSLYLRLIIGHECKALSPEQILVVTFTKAATEELRDRIRKRIKMALSELDKPVSSDVVIESIRNDLTAEQVINAKQRLKDALQLMDLAAIYTIHGFAQKLLRQYAVEANVSNEFELIINETDILIQAVQDVWRSSVYPLTGETLSLVLNQWKSPDVLLKDTRNLLYKNVEYHLGHDFSEGAHDYEKASVQYFQAVSELKQEWVVSSAGFISDIRSNKDLNGTFGKGLDAKIKNVELFVSGQKVKSKDLDNALNSFTKQGLLKSVKKNGEPIEHKLSGAFQLVCDYLGPYEKAKSLEIRKWRISFIKKIKQRLQFLKDQKQLVATDDLLNKLGSALELHDDTLLADPVRNMFPVAMVDEFQDTDAVQYQVFRKLYVESSQIPADSGDNDGLVKSQKNNLALFMIGDPKQAIYKFRGADIFTYIQAKQEVTKSYSLDTNYRSSAPMVAAVNTLFTQHTTPFIYDQDIPFVSVAAKDDAARLWLSGVEDKAVSWQYVNTEQREFTKKDEVIECFAQECAEQVAQLLSHPKAELKDKNGSKTVLAKDMAILVRSGRQAQVVKNALNERGVGCVYVGQDNVFESHEAQGLLMLMQAVHALSERKYRNAIAHPIWQLSLTELEANLLDEDLWEQQLEQLYKAHEIWLKQGIMPMVMFWMHERALPQAWLDNVNGERILTNMMHLAELLQDATSEVQGMQGLMTWFDQQVMDSLLGDGEQKQLRLESDANLVQIVTIHKSKGLEYPIVFLPYCWSGTESKDEVFYDQENEQLRCDLADDYKVQRIQEGLAEEIRLLYVGLTRAASKCYLAMPSFTTNKKAFRLNKAIKDSALNHLLFESNHSETDVWQHLSDLCNQSGSEVFDMAPLLETCTRVSAKEQAESLAAMNYTGHIKRDWQLSSFSSLVRDHHAPQTARFNLDDEVAQTSDQSSANVDAAASSNDVDFTDVENQFTFPRGAHAGNFLHTLLEEVDFTCLPDNLDSLITDLLVRFGIDDKWLQVVKNWLDEILSSPLSHPDLSLSQLSDDLKQVEMEFYFPISRLPSAAFNNLVNQHAVLECPVSDVEFYTIKGMMKGFIDLTFCWNDQYFILDYKSNHLGNDLDCYQQPALHEAMGSHRYDIQLILYTLALHRLLKLRIPNYEYEQHIGGGYYLFLRGLNADNHNGQFFHKPSKDLIFALDDLISGEQERQKSISSVSKDVNTDSSDSKIDSLNEDGQLGFLV
jgi:exodeoxyribonuclease V beta subunit